MKQKKSLSDKPIVAVAIVTYGSRTHFFSKVFKGVLSQTAANRIGLIVVCDNGADSQTKDLLVSLTNQEPRLHITTLPINMGSAAGYAAAIRVAADSGYEYIWCLDDDNLPAPDALQQLLLAMEIVEPGAALLSLREDRPQYVQRALGCSLKDAFGRSYSFLGFSVLDLPKKLRQRISPFSIDTNSFPVYIEKPLQVPYAPYGGFFFRADQVSQVGLPRADFHLYGDDHEFTARFVRKGFPIYLVPQSKIRDLERSWSHDRISVTRWGSQLLLHDGEEEKINRLYYSVRNRIYSEVHTFGWAKHISYWLNSTVYLSILFIQALAMRLRRNQLPWTSFLIALKAVRDGLYGRLGQLEDSR